MDVEQITDWLWCLRTPLVQAYAVRHSDGFHLIDTSTAGHEGAILDALGSVAGSAGRDVAIRDVLLTHGHDDHTGSAAILDWEVPGRIVAAPGHTPGSVAVLFEDAGVLVAGDAIASHEDTPMVGVFNADLPQAVATFRQLATLDVDIACFGHGAPLVGDAGARLQQVAASL
jgi:glyoxylase-like metal-dependent hydrolase (beta-lactamase superfamily II)